VQAYVPGRGAGVFALCDRGRVLAWFAHERLRDVRPSGSGSSVRRSVPLSPRLREPAERLLASMEWHGPAMVEFRDEDGQPPCLMEVNGRFWNSLQLAIEAGVDFPRLWLAVLRGEHVTPPAAYAEGVTVRWLWGDVKRLLYVLAGPPRGCPMTYPTVWQGMREVLGPQTPASRLEVWQRGDPWPAVGEWVQGARELWRARSVHQ
jgi:predicted ATP-grasp superfamily ATP-dependent carboligase